MTILKRVLALTLVAGVASAAALAASGGYGAWSTAVRVESIPGTHPDFNGAFLDGCPFISRDGKTFTWLAGRSTEAAAGSTSGSQDARTPMMRGARR